MTSSFYVKVILFLFGFVCMGTSNEMKARHHKHVKHHKHLHEPASSQQQQFVVNTAQPMIYINQSDKIFILAKHGQTVSLPCVIHRQNTPEFTNIHAVWSKLNNRHRTRVLSIGQQQILSNMRHRVKVFPINDKKTHLEDNLDKREQHQQHQQRSRKIEMPYQEEALIYDYSDKPNNLFTSSHVDYEFTGTSHSSEKSSREVNNKKNEIVENWQFEIRKLTYDDSGVYQCSLPLMQPLTKNITLKVIPDIKIEPSEPEFKVNEKLIIECKATLKATDRHRSHKSVRERTGTSAHHVSFNDPQPIIHWYKENELISPKTDRLDIMTRSDSAEHNLHSTLTIHH